MYKWNPRKWQNGSQLKIAESTTKVFQNVIKATNLYVQEAWENLSRINNKKISWYLTCWKPLINNLKASKQNSALHMGENDKNNLWFFG